ncbi:glycosyltransferase family protein [Pseudidiomarina salilacus]|uniref:glycosyltransferase n=1 Tax=Pseudidiomarina salilacus TaxID=3384452 RepID=UPI0039852C9A
MQPVNVLCIKWGQKYGADYVNTLYSMVSRHLSRPFRFVCLTDDNEDIREEVEVKPIPAIGFADFDERKPWTFGHGWLKLTCFAEPLYDLQGPTLFLDLDIVIVGSLDEFFEPEGEFLVIKEWDKSDATGNTSVFRFNIGAHVDALEHLKNDPVGSRKDVRNEQEFITQFVARQGKLKYWPAEWCRSFKRHCLRPFPLSFFQQPRIPEGAKVIIFHGRPHPDDAIAGRSGKWYRKVLPTEWIKEYWR